MTTISIQLPEEQAKRLAALAAEQQTTLEELAKAKLVELLKEPDVSFQEIIRYVLAKNRELYRRLA